MMARFPLWPDLLARWLAPPTPEPLPDPRTAAEVAADDMLDRAARYLRLGDRDLAWMAVVAARHLIMDIPAGDRRIARCDRALSMLPEWRRAAWLAPITPEATP